MGSREEFGIGEGVSKEAAVLRDRILYRFMVPGTVGSPLGIIVEE